MGRDDRERRAHERPVPARRLRGTHPARRRRRHGRPRGRRRHEHRGRDRSRPCGAACPHRRIASPLRSRAHDRAHARDPSRHRADRGLGASRLGRDRRTHDLHGGHRPAQLLGRGTGPRPRSGGAPLHWSPEDRPRGTRRRVHLAGLRPAAGLDRSASHQPVGAGRRTHRRLRRGAALPVSPPAAPQHSLGDRAPGRRVLARPARRYRPRATISTAALEECCASGPAARARSEATTRSRKLAPSRRPGRSRTLAKTTRIWQNGCTS